MEDVITPAPVDDRIIRESLASAIEEAGYEPCTAEGIEAARRRLLEGPVDAVFIRAPWIEESGPGVEILARHGGHGVAAREGDLLVTAFHPELSGERRFHEWLVSRARVRRAGGGQRRGDRVRAQ